MSKQYTPDIEKKELVEMATMEKPSCYGTALYNRKCEHCDKYNDHIKNLTRIKAPFITEEHRGLVMELDKHFRLEYQECAVMTDWASCDEDIYNTIDDSHRRIIAVPITPVQENENVVIDLKVRFTDCWESDKNIPESHRWMAHLPHITAVTAPTKEQAFEEAMISIKAMSAYQSGIKLPTPVQVKPNCAAHKTELFGHGDMKEVADIIGDLHYETLFNLLYHLSKKIDADSIKDNESGREKLAAALQYAGMGIFESALRMEKVWEISKPYMRREPSPTPIQEKEIATGKDKPFIVANVKDITDLYDKEEISYSRMVEMLNEIAFKFFTPVQQEEKKEFSFKEVEWLISKMVCEYAPQHSQIESPGQFILRSIKEYPKEFATPSRQESDAVEHTKWMNIDYNNIPKGDVLLLTTSKVIIIGDWYENQIDEKGWRSSQSIWKFSPPDGKEYLTVLKPEEIISYQPLPTIP